MKTVMCAAAITATLLSSQAWAGQAPPPSPPPPSRLAPIPAERLTDDQKKAAAAVARNGAVPGYLWPMLRNPWLATPSQVMGEGLNRQATLPAKLTQLAILIISKRVAYNGSWVEHSGMAARAGLNAAIVEAIAAGRRPTGMDEDETLIYDMCDELEKTTTISDATFRHAVARLGEAGVVDTVATYGFYYYLGLINNVARTATPSFRPPR